MTWVRELEQQIKDLLGKFEIINDNTCMITLQNGRSYKIVKSSLPYNQYGTCNEYSSGGFVLLTQHNGAFVYLDNYANVELIAKSIIGFSKLASLG